MVASREIARIEKLHRHIRTRFCCLSSYSTAEKQTVELFRLFFQLLGGYAEGRSDVEAPFSMSKFYRHIFEGVAPDNYC